MKPFIEKADFLGLEAYRLGACGYEALIVPCVGANIVELSYKGTGFLRDTSGLTKEAFIARPQVYGIPVLFMPNRISGGKFSFDGREYNFPITDKVHNNHLHGFLHKRPWKIAKSECAGDSAVMELVFECGPETDFFGNFPHMFEFSYIITLSEAGALCNYTIRNLGTVKMPVGLGFHTAFNVPFKGGPTGNETDYFITATVGKRWELNEATLPTGRFIEPDSVTDELKTSGTRAAGQELDAYHFTNQSTLRNGEMFNGAVLNDSKTGVSLVYEWGEKFRHSVIWNLDGKSGFICPEPQTWMIDAPNMDLPDEITGFYALDPGDNWSDYTKISVCGM